MPTSLATALTAVLGLAVNVVAQVALVRLAPRRSFLKSIFAGFGLGLALVVAAHGYRLLSSSVSLAETLCLFLADLTAYGALSYCYFNFLNLGETARRIRILREIHEAGGGLTMAGILARYNAEEICRRRFRRLLGSGQIVLEAGRYRIKSPVLVFGARAMVLLKKLFLGRESEFIKP